jgi:hypothetical protein
VHPLRPLLSVVLAATLLAGCKPPVLPVPDAGEPDAGKPIKPMLDLDAGPPKVQPDAGLVYPASTAAEPCPAETFGEALEADGGALMSDGGYVPTVTFGLCVGLRKLTATARLNDMPASGLVDFRFEAGSFSSELARLPDAFGRVDVRVMKGRYDILKYHPTNIFPTHLGFEEFGPIDLTKDVQRELAVRSHIMRGGVSYATLPFVSQSFPPDISFTANGLPPTQSVSATSIGGGYEVAMLEGAFALYLSSPPSALGGTELLKFPLSNSIQLYGPLMFDVNLKAHELEGQMLIDGKPIPDRRLGDDYQLDFTSTGEVEPTVRTHHDGAVADFHSLVPEGKYSVNLRLESAPDRHLPSIITNKQVAQSVDLSSGNRAMNINLLTHVVEGGIVIDGVPVKPNPAYNYTMYWYGFSGAVDPWSLLYFEIVLDTSTFELRVFPGNYYVMLYIDSNFAPDLVEGWFLVNKYFEVHADNAVMPIEVNTSLFQGHLYIDGVPPPQGAPAGELVFRGRDDGYFYKKITCAEDGQFQVRIPKGSYEVMFYIDRKTFPEYATGRQRMISRLEMENDQVLDLYYDTVLMQGPMRVGGEVVPDTTALEETGLTMVRQQDGRTFEWGFNGGTPNYRLRIPEGDYELTYTIARDVWPDVAWGSAAMGIKLPAHRVEPAPPSK